MHIVLLDQALIGPPVLFSTGAEGFTSRFHTRNVIKSEEELQESDPKQHNFDLIAVVHI